MAVRIQEGKKGNVSIYGLQRFPVTLYADQWLELLENQQELRDFIAEHKDSLKWKADMVVDR